MEFLMRTKTGLLCAFSCLLAAQLGVSAQVLQVGGNPLTIQCDEYGTIGVLRNQQGTNVAQYYTTRAKGSVLFLDGTNAALRFGNGTSTFALWDDASTGRFTSVSHGTVGNSIQTLLAAGTTGVRVMQTLTYVPGEYEYTLRWDISNVASLAFQDVRFLHGGDASLGGADFGVGSWDAVSNRVMIQTNLVSDDFMALRGPQAAAHHEDHFQLVRDACKAGLLPNTVKAESHDAAYALQWNRTTLSPGQTWTINAVETWAGRQAGPSIFTNVTAQAVHPVFESWQLNRQTGTYFGTLRLQLAPGSASLTPPVWLVIDNNNDRRFMQPTGTTPFGKQYLDISAQVAAAAGESLDTGETVRVRNIDVYMRFRANPADSLFSIWATTAGNVGP